MLALAGAGDTAAAVGARLAAGSLLALIAALVLGWPRLVPLSLVFMGAAYAVRLSLDDAGLDTKAPLFAAGLLLTAELAYWSLEERERVRAEPGDDVRRLGFIVGLTLGALLASALVLAAADLARTGGLAVDLLGTAAAAAALLVLMLVARRRQA